MYHKYITIIMLCCLFTGCMTLGSENKPVEEKTHSDEITEINKKLEEIHHQISVIQFMVDNHERTIKDIELSKSNLSSTQKSTNQTDTYGINSSVTDNRQSSNSPETIYKQARQNLNGQNFKQAFLLFEQVINQYPDHDLADNSLYWKGEILYAQKEFEQAISVFQTLLQKYPNGSKVPDALLKTGYSYVNLKDYDNARMVLKKVIKNYPFSPAGVKAEKMLANINP